MSKKRAPGRSLDEWMELVTECRQSGLTDAAWCNEHGISPSCFYNAVTRLRKKACQIPDPVGKASALDLTSQKQDVVQSAIEPVLQLQKSSRGFFLSYLQTKRLRKISLFQGFAVLFCISMCQTPALSASQQPGSRTDESEI